MTSILISTDRKFAFRKNLYMGVYLNSTLTFIVVFRDGGTLDWLFQIKKKKLGDDYHKLLSFKSQWSENFERDDHVYFYVIHNNMTVIFYFFKSLLSKIILVSLTVEVAQNNLHWLVQKKDTSSFACFYSIL